MHMSRSHLLLLPLLTLVLAGNGTSQDSSPVFSKEAYVLAQVCVGEASFHFQDCAPIAEVLKHRAESSGRDLVTMAKAYSALFKQKSKRKKWVRALPNSYQKPANWPGDVLAWGMVQTRWGKMLRYASAIVRGKAPPHQCKGGRPWHWGAANGVDLDRAKTEVTAKRWVPLRCPGAQNLFYAKGPMYGGLARR